MMTAVLRGSALAMSLSCALVLSSLLACGEPAEEGDPQGSGGGGGSAGDAGGGGSAGDAGGGGSAGDGGGGGDGLETPEERETLDRGGTSSLDVQRLLSVSDGMFHFDPTIDPAAAPDANAGAIAADTGASLAGCGTVAVDGTTVTVDFGAPPGCTLNGVPVSGSITLGVSQSGSTTTVTLAFGSFTLDGTSLTGSASFATTTGTTFTVTANLTSAGRTTTANLTLAGAAGAYTLDGTASVAQGEGSTQLTFTGLHYTSGDCYPDGGSFTVKQGLLTLTVTCTTATADSGQVTVKQGRKTYSSTLPPYGSCPAGS